MKETKKVPDIINLCMANDKISGPTDRIMIRHKVYSQKGIPTHKCLHSINVNDSRKRRDEHKIMADLLSFILFVRWGLGRMGAASTSVAHITMINARIQHLNLYGMVAMRSTIHESSETDVKLHAEQFVCKNRKNV